MSETIELRLSRKEARFCEWVMEGVAQWMVTSSGDASRDAARIIALLRRFLKRRASSVKLELHDAQFLYASAQGFSVACDDQLEAPVARRITERLLESGLTAPMPATKPRSDSTLPVMTRRAREQLMITKTPSAG